jgi:MFS family permease
LAILVVFLYLSPSPRAQGRVDYLGGFLLAAGLALLSLAISQQSDEKYFWPFLFVSLGISLICFFFFFLRSRRIPYPIIELSMFKRAVFLVSNITNLLVGAALIIAMVNIPLMTDTIMRGTPLEGGLRLLRLTILLSVGAVLGGFMCRRYGYRVPTVLGLILSGLAFFFLSRWPLSIADPEMTLQLAVCGLGFGLVIAPLGTAAIDSAGEDQHGIASSLVVMMRMIGMIIGLSAITSWGMGRFHLMTASLSINDIMNTPEELVRSLLSLFHDFFLAAMIICGLAIVPALWLRKKVGQG